MPVLTKLQLFHCSACMFHKCGRTGHKTDSTKLGLETEMLWQGRRYFVMRSTYNRLLLKNRHFQISLLPEFGCDKQCHLY